MNSKFKNPYFWLGIIGVLFSASGIDFETLTTWSLLVEALSSILHNPVLLLSVVTALLGIWNDNGTSGLDSLTKNEK